MALTLQDPRGERVIGVPDAPEPLATHAPPPDRPEADEMVRAGADSCPGVVLAP